MFEGISILFAVFFSCLAINTHVCRHLATTEITDAELVEYNRMLQEAIARRATNYF